VVNKREKAEIKTFKLAPVETGMRTKEKKRKIMPANISPAPPAWIGMPSALRGRSAPLLRKSFHIGQPVKKATWRICGLGYYEACLNGGRVGDHVLDPAQTDYDQRWFYVTYNVGNFVRQGKNALGVMLGDGFYNQDLVPAAYGWQGAAGSYGQPCLWAELVVELTNGSIQHVVTESSWKCLPGPITESNVYKGEQYDARREIPGWAGPEFDDAGWCPVEMAGGPGGAGEEQPMPPVRRIAELRPQNITAFEDNSRVVDFGQNFAGWARIRVSAPAGTRITLVFAETVFPDGRINTASTGVFATTFEQTDEYICKGRGREEWEPRFTYHGFRYVRVSGWPGELTADDLTGVVVHTDLQPAGEFHCSDERLNQLHTMVLWTHRSNIHSIPEDCPARERCGWLGDANLVAEYSMWNYHAETFWLKFIDDMETTRSGNAGLPCNIAPGKRTAGTANPDWAAAFILLPWYVYLFYGKSGVLLRHWDGLRFLMDHFEKQATDGILAGGFGDWFDPGREKCCNHTPPTLTTTLWYYQCAQVMATAAAVTSHPADAEHYAQLAATIGKAFNHKYYDPIVGSYGSQAANVMALHFGLAAAGEKERVLQSLVNDIRQREVHLNTGIMGVRFIFEVLTRNGQGALALSLLHQDTYPGFGDQIKRGATTLWEWWGEMDHQQAKGPRSMNHPMFGGFDNWFYNTLAGIRPDPQQPGFKRFYLEPHPIPGLDFVKCQYESPFGRIVSAWTLKNNNFAWQITMPENTSATVRLPCSGEKSSVGPGTHTFRCDLS
jgi:alpha-L-rhamnosidase